MTEQRYNAIFKQLKTAHYEKERGRRDRIRQILDTLTSDEGASLFNRICSLYGKGILFKPNGGPAQIHRMNTYRHLAEAMRRRQETGIND